MTGHMEDGDVLESNRDGQIACMRKHHSADKENVLQYSHSVVIAQQRVSM